MGKSDYEIMQILSITKETLRTLRHRTKPKE
jgi:DNA-binding CsgD family transcriptional regulator